MSNKREFKVGDKVVITNNGDGTVFTIINIGLSKNFPMVLTPEPPNRVNAFMDSELRIATPLEELL